MDERERKIRQRLKDDFTHYAAKCLKVRTKEGQILPLALNTAQLYIDKCVSQQKSATGKVRAIVLKGRQQGVSTYVEGRFYWLVTHRLGVRAFILTHEDEATKNLFEMAKRYHENCPQIVRPEIEASNSRELVFGKLNSGYRLGTAGNKAVGRSSTIQFLHASEAAYFQHAADHAKGILQAVPNAAGTEIFIESTANGVGNYFHEQWQQAEAGHGEFMPVFVPWFWQTEYQETAPKSFKCDEEELEIKSYYELSNEQLMWRRKKIVELSAGGGDGKKNFKTEYPCTPNEAFVYSGDDCFITSHITDTAAHAEAEAVGPLIIGADIARFGNDRTCIIRRRGRVAFNIQTFIKKDNMEVAGILNKIIIEERPDIVCIDVVGLGSGVFDRLKELGHGSVIKAVNGGESPLDADKYYNKRAEMWGLMKEWLCDQPAKIPNDPALMADLCNPLYKYDSKSRLIIEGKEAMKKRGVRSPDIADSLSMTFSLPDFGILKRNQQKHSTFGRDMAQTAAHFDRLKTKAYK